MSQENQRENVRVNDRLVVCYRLLDSADSKDLESAERVFPFIWSKYPSSLIVEESEDSNFRILPHIIDLNRKIDILFEFLISEKRPLVEVPEIKDVSISASGLKITIKESSLPGQKIALCIILPFVPPHKLFLIGEITRSIQITPVSDREGPTYETGINFLNLKEEDREKIIKYIFKRQRDFLRGKKMLTNAEDID